MRYHSDREAFGAFITELRRKHDFTLEQVCEGLCTPQQLSRFEKGEKAAPKLLQDALLERLGIGEEIYEHYLNYEAYDQWEMRQRILHRISYGETGRARELLGEYCSLYGGDTDGGITFIQRLERQFYLSMQAQIRRMEGAGREELYALLEEAVHLTVSVPWEKPLRGRVLSFKELNLLLEMEEYRKEGVWTEHYREIVDYMEESGADAAGMAKIYPKAVYCLCRSIQKQGLMEEEKLLHYCRRGIEILRDSCRTYYLWELLDLRAGCLERLRLQALGDGDTEKAEGIARAGRENAGWKGVLEKVYGEYRIPKETLHYCYLYVEKGVFCISDVIRIRRRMLQMTAEELCEGICDVKTLRRLENRRSNSQRAVVEALFERLGLARDLTRTELVTADPEARRLMSVLRNDMNDYKVEGAHVLLEQIRARVSAEIRSNQQALMRGELNIQRFRKEISDEAYCRQMKEALEMTLPYDAFLREGEKYLTYEEQACIQNRMHKMDPSGEEFRICMKRFEEMYHSVVQDEMLGTKVGVYTLIMGYVGSEMGNRGEYDRSNEYIENILEEELRSHRMYSIASCLYDRWWNNSQRERSNIPVRKELKNEEELTKCILLSQLSKQERRESFYREKLKIFL